MGLDWCVTRKVHPDHAARAARLEAALDGDELTDKKRDGLIAQLEEISEAPEETLKAPRVGIDEAATEWFRELWEEEHERAITGRASGPELTVIGPDGDAQTFDEGPDWSRPFEEILEHAKGTPVVQLSDYVPPSFVGSPMAGPLSFRGKALASLEELPEKLQEEAYENHTPKESLAFATRIEKAILRLSRSKSKSVAPLAKKYDELRAKAAKVHEEAVEPLVAEGMEPFAASLKASEAVEKWRKELSKADRAVLELGPAFEAVTWLRFWGERGHGFQAWF